MKIVIVLLVLWAIGFVLTFGFHRVFLQMVTPALALERSVVWPIYWATGRPRGVPLPMDE